MSNRPLLPYDPNACGCCGCPPVTVVIENRGDGAVRWGYFGFVNIGNRYRTTVSRGWGSGFYGLTHNAVACSYLPFATGDVVPAQTGFCESIVYPCYPETVECPAVESDDCNDGFFSFHPTLGGGSNETRFDASHFEENLTPVGVEWLLNLITPAEFFAEIIDASRAAPWVPGDNAISYFAKTGFQDAAGYVMSRFCFRFQPLSAAGLEVSWSVYWTPRTWNGTEWVNGTTVLYEDASWRWDDVVPGDYTPGNVNTWPRSPQFELPEATTEGVYEMQDVVVVCGSSGVPTAPGAIFGHVE